ncbi:hypothetical protein [Nonomuraea dietziae]|uniref:hypothetical protein n=1 Tax=Nonomuraea dietziae TaxID=65515 RepID=UPI0031E20283
MLTARANGDHTYAASCCPARCASSPLEANAHEMRAEMAPELTTAAAGDGTSAGLTPYLRDRFGGFDFGGMPPADDPTTPSRPAAHTSTWAVAEVRLLNS